MVAMRNRTTQAPVLAPHNRSKGQVESGSTNRLCCCAAWRHFVVPIPFYTKEERGASDVIENVSEASDRVAIVVACRIEDSTA